MKKILLSIFFFLAAIFIAAQADADYVSNPNDCPSSYLSQTCVSPTPNVCGVSTNNVVQCYNTANIQPRSSSSSVESGTITTSGGYYVNCTAPMDSASPYCDNNGNFWCLQKSSCDSAKLKTICTGGAWASATCGACKTGYHDCNNDGDCSDSDEHDGVSCDGGLGYWNNCTCVRSILQLGPDSVSSTGVIIQSAANPLMYIGSGVSIGTSTIEASTFNVVGASRFFNPVTVDTPTDTGHAATKSYVDSMALAAGSALWTLSSSSLYASSTDWNVGIGTTSPGAKLDVNGSLAVRGSVSFTGPLYINGGNRLLMVDNSGTVTATSTQAGISMPSGSAGQTLRYGSGGWEATSTIYVQGGGNVGIGTTSPTQKLSVVGNMALTTPAGNVRGFMMTSSGGDYNKFYYLGTGGSGGTAGDNVIFEDNRASMTGGHTFFKIKRTGLMTTGNIFEVSHDGSSHDFLVYNNGNVGIGTTSPAASLAVNGNAIANTPTADGHLATKAYVDSASQSLWVKNGSNLYTSSTSWNVGIGTTSPGAKLDVNGSLAVRGAVSFTSSLYVGGNVGIGSTTSPADKLQVFGNTFLGRISGYPFKSLWTWESDDTGYYSGIGYQKYDDTDKKLFVWWKDNTLETNINSVLNVATPGHTFDGTAPNSERTIGVKLSSSGNSYFNGGNVGIGTTSPSVPLAVNGYAIADPPTNSKYLATKGYVDSMASAASSALWVNSSSNLYASSTSWNVGIGTTNPGTAKLAVMGGNMGIGTTNPKGLLQIDSSTSDPLKLRVHTELGSANSLAGIAFGVDTGNQYMKSAIALQRKNSNGQGDLVFMVDSNSDGSNVDINDEKLRIQGSSGNVGIGTTSPSYKLDVNGGGSFTQFVFVPTPTDAGHAVNKGYVDSVFSSTTANYVLKTGDTMTGTLEFATSTQVYTAINLNGNNISAVHKLGVVVIDPLYDIGGTKYSSYAPSVVGGVKEEHIGKGTIKDCNHNVCSWVLDFSKVAKGSDLWVWRQIVDFRPETIDVLMTAYGRPASLSYEIGDNQIIFYADHPTQFSYRLVGSRFDWRQWPTLALDQSEPTSLIVP